MLRMIGAKRAESGKEVESITVFLFLLCSAHFLPDLMIPETRSYHELHPFGLVARGNQNISTLVAVGTYSDTLLHNQSVLATRIWGLEKGGSIRARTPGHIAQEANSPCTRVSTQNTW